MTPLPTSLTKLRAETAASMKLRGKSYGPDPKLIKGLVEAEKAWTKELWALRKMA